jgi:hypothetical protein
MRRPLGRYARKSERALAGWLGLAQRFRASNHSAQIRPLGRPNTRPASRCGRSLDAQIGRTRPTLERVMPKQPASVRPGEPPRPQPPGGDIRPVDAAPERPDVEPAGFSDRHSGDAPTRDSVPPATPQKRAKRRWDRYDFIGTAIVAFLLALWAVHFSLPTLPPDNVPDANQPVGRN